MRKLSLTKWIVSLVSSLALLSSWNNAWAIGDSGSALCQSHAQAVTILNNKSEGVFSVDATSGAGEVAIGTLYSWSGCHTTAEDIIIANNGGDVIGDAHKAVFISGIFIGTNDSGTELSSSAVNTATTAGLVTNIVAGDGALSAKLNAIVDTTNKKLYTPLCTMRQYETTSRNFSFTETNASSQTAVRPKYGDAHGGSSAARIACTWNGTATYALSLDTNTYQTETAQITASTYPASALTSKLSLSAALTNLLIKSGGASGNPSIYVEVTTAYNATAGNCKDDTGSSAICEGVVAADAVGG